MTRAARKPKEKAMTAANDAPPPSAGHNGLTPDQKLCLALRHRRTFEEIDAREKAVKAEKRNFGKVLKIDLGESGLDQIKIMIRRRTPEGAAKVDAELAAMREAISWSAGEDGQFEMFAEKKPQGESAAFLAGKLSAMDAEAQRNPYGPGTADHDDYARGFQAGEAVYKEMNERLAAPVAELITGADGGDLDDGGEG